MSSIIVLLLMLSSIALQSTAVRSIGVCYGTNGTNLPSRKEVIDLYKSNGINRMRIYSPDPEALQALRGSNIEVLLGVNDLQSFTDPSHANGWVNNFLASYSDVNIKYIAVGNEIHPSTPEFQKILPAMKNIQSAISSSELRGKVKVSTAIKFNLLENTYPPMKAKFTGPTASPFIKPIVDFLVSNGAPLLANVYPYFAYLDDQNVQLDFALFKQQGTNGGYQNLFDAMLDSIYYALEKIGAQNLEVVVSESGWPSDGGQKGASVENAGTYYRNLISHVKGFTTPKHNGAIETYLFAMFDENDKHGLATEKHFGLFNPDKLPKYGGIKFN